MKIFLTGATGYIGGTVAVELLRAGHSVRGLVRDAARGPALRELGLEPVVGTLDDHATLVQEARAADAVINAADSDHAPSIASFVEALAGSDKPFLHTSGSSIVSTASNGEATADVFDDDHLPEPAADKVARMAIDQSVRDAARQKIRSLVLCDTLVYGRGRGIARDSVQIPLLVATARKSGVVRYIGKGQNVWSTVHVEDAAVLYRLAVESLARDAGAAGGFHFVENGEASFRAIAESLAAALGMKAESWSAEDGAREWGFEMSTYGLGSNSRVRSPGSRERFGWKPARESVTEWIAAELGGDGNRRSVG